LALAAYSRQVQAAALSCRKLLKLSRDHGSIVEAEAARREASLRLAQSRSAGRDALSPAESAELDNLSRFVHASGNLLDKIRRLKARGRRKEAAALYDSGLRPLVERYVAGGVSDRLREEEESRLENQRSALLWTRLTAAASAAFAVLTALLFFLWTRALLGVAEGNLAKVGEAVTALRAGRLRLTIEPDRADEWGAVCTDLKSLAARLEQAQGRFDAVGDLAHEVSRTLHQTLFALNEFKALARHKGTLDADDLAALDAVLDSAGKCNLLLARLSEHVAGQKILAGDSPELIEAIDALSAALAPARSKTES
jgi:hypothetical protein